MAERFDVVVVGSGFGGAAAACRLAQCGARVLVLERGRRWTLAEYPRKTGDAWLYHPAKPEKLNDWLDLRFLGTVVAGKGPAQLSTTSMPASAAASAARSSSDATRIERAELLRQWGDRLGSAAAQHRR